MFSKWGEFVQRHRVLVLIIMVVLVAALGVVGQKLPDYLSQSGWFDPASDSITAADTEEHTFGRDNSADVVVMYDAPAGSFQRALRVEELESGRIVTFSSFLV